MRYIIYFLFILYFALMSLAVCKIIKHSSFKSEKNEKNIFTNKIVSMLSSGYLVFIIIGLLIAFICLNR